MNKSELEYIISDLQFEKYRSDQIEKNVEKWIKKLLKHLYDQSARSDDIIALLKLILGIFYLL